MAIGLSYQTTYQDKLIILKVEISMDQVLVIHSSNGWEYRQYTLISGESVFIGNAPYKTLKIGEAVIEFDEEIGAVYTIENNELDHIYVSKGYNRWYDKESQTEYLEDILKDKGGKW